MAVTMCEAILQRIGVTNYEIVTLGKKWLVCRNCEASGMEKCVHLFKYTHCPTCGEYLPYPPDFHSSVEWDGQDWQIRFGRNVTQRKSPLPEMDKFPPYYSMSKSGRPDDGDYWPMFANMCFTLAPLTMAHIKQLNRRGIIDTFTNWRLNSKSRHTRWAINLAKQVHPILMPFVGAITNVNSVVVEQSNISSKSDQLAARQSVIAQQNESPDDFINRILDRAQARYEQDRHGR